MGAGNKGSFGGMNWVRGIVSIVGHINKP